MSKANYNRIEASPSKKSIEDNLQSQIECGVKGCDREGHPIWVVDGDTVTRCFSHEKDFLGVSS